jgi:hypothetical protein
MTCNCNLCRKIEIGCSTGMDCECFPCNSPNTARLELNFQYVCACREFSTNYWGTGGTYCVKCCDFQERYDNFYNGVYLVNKIGTDRCNNFSYRFTHEYQENLIPYYHGFGLYPYIDIQISMFNINISFISLDYPCGPPVFAGGIHYNGGVPTSINYSRNTLVSCDTRTLTYKTRTHSYCFHPPREITVELLDI